MYKNVCEGRKNAVKHTLIRITIRTSMRLCYSPSNKSGIHILVKPTCNLTAFARLLWLRLARVDYEALCVRPYSILRLICTQLCLRIHDLEDVYMIQRGQRISPRHRHDGVPFKMFWKASPTASFASAEVSMNVSPFSSGRAMRR